MSEYQDDRRWSEQFIPEIKRIVGPQLLVVTPDDIDCTQAADLMVFTARDMKIAARIRRHGFAEKYGNEFTIRSKRTNGAVTELAKIVNGWGDWMFYGHADQFGSGLSLWWLLDLHAFRAALIRQAMNKNGLGIRCGDKSNRDDATYFKWFDITSFPPVPPLVIASSRQAIR